MQELRVSYNNADGLFRYDEEIREAMSRLSSEETDSGQNLETHMRHITHVFEDEGDDSLALEDLADILGVCFREVTYTRQPEKAKSPGMAIDFDPDQSQRSRESVSVLRFGRCVGLKHRHDIGTTRPHTAQEVFDSFLEQFGWDFKIQRDVLVNWCGEVMIEPLLRDIQEAEQTADFEQFLIDSFCDDRSRATMPNDPTARETASDSLRHRQVAASHVQPCGCCIQSACTRSMRSV